MTKTKTFSKHSRHCSAIKPFVTAILLPALLLIVARGGEDIPIINCVHAFYSNSRNSCNSNNRRSKVCQSQQQKEQKVSGIVKRIKIITSTRTSTSIDRHHLSSSTTPNDAGDQKIPPQQPPPIIDIELPSDDDNDNDATIAEEKAADPTEKSSAREEEDGQDVVVAATTAPVVVAESEMPPDDMDIDIDLDLDLDAAIAAAVTVPVPTSTSTRASSKAGILVNDPLSEGTESRSMLNGDNIQSSSSSSSQTIPNAAVPVGKRRLVPYQKQQNSEQPTLPKAKARGRSMFQASGNDSLSFDEATPSKKPKMVQRAAPNKNKQQLPPSTTTFRSSDLSDMSFEAKPSLFAPKKRRVMAKSVVEPSSRSTSSSTTTTFQQNDLGDISFDAKLEALTSKRIVQMEAKDQEPEVPAASAPSTTNNTVVVETVVGGSDISSETKKDPPISATSTPATTKKQRVVKMAEKKEFAPSTFESKSSGISFEPKAEILPPPKKKRIVQMTEKKEYAPSTFESKSSGISFEAKPNIVAPPKKQRAVFPKMTDDSSSNDNDDDEESSAASTSTPSYSAMPTPTLTSSESQNDYSEGEVEIEGIVPAEKKEPAAPSTKTTTATATVFESIDSKMFGAQVVKQAAPESTPTEPERSVVANTTEINVQQQPPAAAAPSTTTTFQSSSSEISFEAKPITSGATKKQRIVKMTEKKEPAATTTFQPSALSDMSFEVEPVLAASETTKKKQRIVKMPEKTQPAPSTFRNDSSGMMFEAAPGMMFEAAVVKRKSSTSTPQKEKVQPQVAPKATIPPPQVEEEEKPQPQVAPKATTPLPQGEEEEEEKEQPQAVPKATIPPPREEYEPASGMMFEATGNKEESLEVPQEKEMVQPQESPKAKISRPEQEEEQPQPRVVPQQTENKTSTPTKATIVEGIYGGTSLEGKPPAMSDPSKKKFVPASTTSMFRGKTPGTEKPPPSKTMFQSTTPKLEKPPPSKTMFQSTTSKLATPTPSRTMFRSEVSEKEKPAPSRMMFRSEVSEKEKRPPSKTMFRSEVSKKEISPPSRTMFRSEVSEKEISPPSRTMFPRQDSERTSETKPEAEDSVASKSLDSIKPIIPAQPSLKEKEAHQEVVIPDEPQGISPKLVETKNAPPMTKAPRSENDRISYETKEMPPKKQRIVKMTEKKEAPRSKVFESKNSDMSFEAKKSPPTEQVKRIVKMTEKKEPPPSKVFESKDSDMSFEAKKSPPTERVKRIVKMTEKKEAPPSNAFESDESGMMFEARRRPAPNVVEGGSMFKAGTTQPPKKKRTPFKNLVKSTGAVIGSMFSARTLAAPPAEEKEQARLAEVARQKETARVAEQMRLAEENRLQEEAREKEKAGVAEQMRLAEQNRIQEAREKERDRVAEQMRLAEENRLQEEARLAHEAQLAKEARLKGEERLAQAEKVVEDVRVVEENRLAEEIRLKEEAQLKEKAKLDARNAEEEKELSEIGRLVEEVREKEETATLAEEARKELAEEARVAQRKAETTRVAKESQLADDAQEKAPEVVSKKSVEESSPIAEAMSVRDGISTENIPSRSASAKTIKHRDSGIGVEIIAGSSSPRRLVKMTEKKDPPPQKVFQGASDSISFKAEPSKPREPTQRIIKMTEKKVVPTPKVFQGANDSMSFNAEPSKTRILKTTEKKDLPNSKSDVSNRPKAIVADASSSGLFQRGSKKATFESDGADFVYQSPKEKRLFLAQKVAAQMFKAQESIPATFQTSDDGMNVVITGRKPTKVVAVKPVAKESDESNRLNRDKDAVFQNLPGTMPEKSDSDSMTMASFVANNLSKQSVSAFGSIQQSKMNVGSAKTTAKDIKKFAKFVSDGLQMVNEDLQKKNKVITLEEARRQKKERERKRIFGFEIGPSEEEMAAQLMEDGKQIAMEGGKQFAKFASDGLQMVYRAAEKQTQEYIASSATAAAENMDSSDVKEIKPFSNEETSAPFFAATDGNSVTKKAKKSQPSTVAEDVPSTSYATTTDSGTKSKERTNKDDKPKKINLVTEPPKPFYAAAANEDNNISQLKAEKAPDKAEATTPAAAATGHVSEKPIQPASTSSLLRSGGRMFAKFVGDGLQMVQKVAKEKQCRRPSK